MEHNTGNKAVPQFVVTDLLTKNFTLDTVTVKFCNIVTTGLHNGRNEDISIEYTRQKAVHTFEI